MYFSFHIDKVKPNTFKHRTMLAQLIRNQDSQSYVSTAKMISMVMRFCCVVELLIYSSLAYLFFYSIVILSYSILNLFKISFFRPNKIHCPRNRIITMNQHVWLNVMIVKNKSNVSSTKKKLWRRSSKN